MFPARGTHKRSHDDMDASAISNPDRRTKKIKVKPEIAANQGQEPNLHTRNMIDD